MANMPPKHFDDGRENALKEYVFQQDVSRLQNNPRAILDTINHFVKNKSGMMIFHDYKLEVSRKVLEDISPKPKVIVELGTYVGNSAIAWGAMLQEFHTSTELSACKVFGTELNKDFAAIAQSFVDLAGLSQLVEIVQGEAALTLKSLKSSKRIQHIDMLFIDHWEKFYLSDLQICEDLGLLKKGTIIIADNTDFPGAPDYLKYVQGGGERKGYRYESKTLTTAGPEGRPNLLEVTTVIAAPS